MIDFAWGQRLSHSPMFVPFLFRKVGQETAKGLGFSQKLKEISGTLEGKVEPITSPQAAT